MDKQQFFQHLVPIEQDQLWFGKYAKDLSKEISSNMWGIPVPAKLLDEVETAELVQFFQRVMDNRTLQIRKHGKQGMLFYVWTDDESGELRLNCISDFHKKLPFSGEVERTDDLAAVIDEYLMIARAIAADEALHASNLNDIENADDDEVSNSEDLSEEESEVRDQEEPDDDEEKLLVYVSRLG